MDKPDSPATGEASTRPVSSLRSHFEALKPVVKPKADALRGSLAALKSLDTAPTAVLPPSGASSDLPRPIWPGSHHDGLEDSSTRGAESIKRRSVSPTKSLHRHHRSLAAPASPQMTPSFRVDSPSSPPRAHYGLGSSTSLTAPDGVDTTPFAKVRELISQHSSRTASPAPPSPRPDKPPRPVKLSDRPRIPAGPPAAKPSIPPINVPAPNASPNLQPEAPRASFEASRISPFSTPPSTVGDSIPKHDARFMGFQRPAPPPERRDPRTLGFAQASPGFAQSSPGFVQASPGFAQASPGFAQASPGFIQASPSFAQASPGFAQATPGPPSRDVSLAPARASTVSERPSVRDARTLGYSQADRPQPRHVSENLRSRSPALPSPSQPVKIGASRDSRTLGFGPSAVGNGPAPEDATPTARARRPTIRAPPPPRPSDSMSTTPRKIRQPSPIPPDRSTKPAPQGAPVKAATQQLIAKAPALPADAPFPPLPKRNTSGHKTEYPDANHSNRRPPLYHSGLQGLHFKAESRAYDVCGNYLCVAGFMTKVFDISTGEQLSAINHGDTIRASAVRFKPAADVATEAKRIWIGNNAGELQEIDVLTHTLIAENSSHNRCEIVRILRHGRDLWTLDSEGKLFVWPADESGTPNLKYSHITHRVPKGHTFSLVVRDNLWLATGKEVRVYRPGSEANFAPLSKPLSQPGTGDITSGTSGEEDDGGRVYFGHTDGRVTIYSTSDYACVGNVKASDYKINGLAISGTSLWAAYKTGKIYVYDVTKSPWKVQKDWRAHAGPIIGLTLDPKTIWTLQRMQITSIGHDGQARFWDGLLEEDWIEDSLQDCEVSYCSFREVRAAVVTWNCGACTPHDLRTDFIADAIHSDDPPEIIAFGFQEVVDLEDRAVTAKSILGFGKRKDVDSTEQHQSRVYREWRDYLSKLISRYTGGQYTYSELHTSSLIGLFQCIFIRQEERPRLRNVYATNIKCGMKGRYGNKGGLVTRFIIDDTSLCFVNCHLAAGQTQTSHRNNDVATILESDNLAQEPDPDERISLFTGGGDGTQILDHEVCILNGDLNYRIDTVPRDTVIKMIKANDLAKLLERDQIMLSRRRVSGFRLSSFVEFPIAFAPTYKYDVGTDNYDTSEKRRSPAWCDRILYRGPGRVKQLEYRRHEVRVSDHRPVSGLFKIRLKTVDGAKRAKVKKECEATFDRLMKTLCIAVFTDIFLYGVIVPVLPFAINMRAGVPTENVQHWVSVLLAVYGASLLVAAPICGVLADRYGSRRIPLLVGLVVLMGATMMLCFGRSIAVLVVGRLLQGGSAAVVWTVAMAMLVDTTSGEDTGMMIGYVAVSYSLGVLVAPLLGGAVYSRGGYYAVFGMTFGVIGVDIVLRVVVVEKQEARRTFGWDSLGAGLIFIPLFVPSFLGPVIGYIVDRLREMMTGIDALVVLRAAQAVVALIIMSIFASVASSYNRLATCPTSIAFLIFTGVWTLLVILPFTVAAPRYFPKLAHPYAMVVAESTTTIFYFCGFIAVANLIRTLDTCRGLVCHSATAGTVFSAFEFAFFAASSYFAINHVMSRGSMNEIGSVGKDVESLSSTQSRNDRGGMMATVRGWLGRSKEDGGERI
ncbi:hypothetical protein DV737_g1458, partial [Chaetothyriales sp. CBS 132003]